MNTNLNDFIFPSDFPEKLGVINVIDSVVSFEYLIEVNYKDSISFKKTSYHIKD